MLWKLEEFEKEALNHVFSVLAGTATFRSPREREASVEQSMRMLTQAIFPGALHSGVKLDYLHDRRVITVNVLMPDFLFSMSMFKSDDYQGDVSIRGYDKNFKYESVAKLREFSTDGLLQAIVDAVLTIETYVLGHTFEENEIAHWLRLYESNECFCALSEITSFGTQSLYDAEYRRRTALEPNSDDESAFRRWYATLSEHEEINEHPFDFTSFLFDKPSALTNLYRFEGKNRNRFTKGWFKRIFKAKEEVKEGFEW